MEQKSKTYIRPIVIVMIFVFLTIVYAYLTSISLKPGILYEYGDGSKENPYYNKTE